MLEALFDPGNASTLVPSLLTLFTFVTVLAVTAFVAYLRARRQNRHYKKALDYMTQGLCMMDGKMRVIVCNDRYVKMYGMSSAIVKPGATLRDVLDHRRAIGQFSGDVDKYLSEIQGRIAKGEAQKLILSLADGRKISLAEQALEGGGWVATHDDVTEQYGVEQQRAAMQAKDQRRTVIEAAIGSFRERVESVLRSVGDDAIAMKSTATALFAASEQTSKQAEGAVRKSVV